MQKLLNSLLLIAGLASTSLSLHGWTHTFVNETDRYFTIKVADILGNQYRGEVHPHSTGTIEVGPACIETADMYDYDVTKYMFPPSTLHISVPTSRNKCSGHTYTIRNVSGYLDVQLD